MEKFDETGKVVSPMRIGKGVRLLFRKAPAIDRPTADWMDVAQVVLPYTYFSEAEVRPAVFLYDTVRRGTPLSASDTDPQATVLSSVTGAVSGTREVVHPLYGVLHCAVIDRLSAEPEPDVPVPLTGELDREEVCEAAEKAHIIDELDGVPLALKLREWYETGCDYLVADGVQIQPYESSAWAVLRDHAEQVVEGLSLAARAVGTTHYHIAVWRCVSAGGVCIKPIRIIRPGNRFAVPRVPTRAPSHRMRVFAVLACRRVWHCTARFIFVNPTIAAP